MPARRTDRRLGHEAQTIGLALELAARTDQLVFGPAIAARSHVQSGRLVELSVQGWDVHEPLHLACNSDRVLSRTQGAIAKALRARFAELP